MSARGRGVERARPLGSGLGRGRARRPPRRRRAMSSASRPARSMSSTPSSGSTPPEPPAPVLGERRRRAARGRARRAQVPSCSGTRNGARWLAIEPPADAGVAHPARRSASGRRRAGETAGGPARGRRSRAPAEAVSRPPASSSSAASAASTPLVCRSERSARRTRRSLVLGLALDAVPNVAWMSGANASMSGHMTITSRGSRRRDRPRARRAPRRAAPPPAGRGRGRRGR